MVIALDLRYPYCSRGRLYLYFRWHCSILINLDSVNDLIQIPGAAKQQLHRALAAAQACTNLPLLRRPDDSLQLSSALAWLAYLLLLCYIE